MDWHKRGQIFSVTISLTLNMRLWRFCSFCLNLSIDGKVCACKCLWSCNNKIKQFLITWASSKKIRERDSGETTRHHFNVALSRFYSFPIWYENFILKLQVPNKKSINEWINFLHINGCQSLKTTVSVLNPPHKQTCSHIEKETKPTEQNKN